MKTGYDLDIYIVYKVKLSLTYFVFKKKPSACFVLLLIMKRNELFVTVSILTSIISFVFLNILFEFFSSGTQSSKLLIKSQHIQRINHFTFNECGKGWGGGGVAKEF